MKEIIVNLIIYYSQLYGVDPSVALSVAKIESNYNALAVGSSGEIGVFQIMPEYAHVSRDLLFNPVVNVMIGVKRLKEEQLYCIHKDDINYLVCYNYGRNNAKKVKHAHLFPYVVKVRNEMEKF